ncbi:hypothetical protein E4U21_006524 [Claviceps maximensis]|nr:hypothetical protein E4U21_006524 [Claviceps maximensis]
MDNRTCITEGGDFIDPNKKNNDIQLQLVLSLILGISAFFTFCILRPRWPALYSAHKRRLHPHVDLPTLTDSFLGWIPQLYRINEKQILAASGLDAFVFLAFFKMAIRLFFVMTFFAILVLGPINAKYRKSPWDFVSATSIAHQTTGRELLSPSVSSHADVFHLLGDKDEDKSREMPFLWTYVVFTYFFVGLTLYSINWETFRIIDLRQKYLGSQSTVTDRTFRLTGIPKKHRSEEKLKSLIEGLDIGLVDSVTLCRDWKYLDELVAHRDAVLRKLEASWAAYLRTTRDKTPKKHSDATQTNGARSVNGQLSDEISDEEAAENARLLASEPSQPHMYEGKRPQVTVRYGPLLLRSRKVDAIDYYEEKLRRVDEQVVEARKKEYATTDMALVTMDSVASCQMVIQARIDPRPGRFLTKPTPSPSDLVWKNTYARRGIRRLKSWSITLFITFLTLIWIFPTAALASFLSFCTIDRALPQFAEWLNEHPIVRSFFQNTAPTLVVSLLNVSVPYLYDWLSNNQGMISQGDVELSVISKNFFFTFFNTFFVFAVSKTGFEFWSVLRRFLKDTSLIPMLIAQDVENLARFYISFIILQGVGLMPFKILEIGSVFLAPIYRWKSTTPRDFNEIQKPPIFQYGFYLPTALLVFNLCLIYSVLVEGWVILIFGIIYFGLGYFTFKYMLLYAMDQPQHATGGAWRIICYRIVVGLLVFEIVMVGQIASFQALVQSAAVLPIIPFTIWYSYYFSRRFEPLTKCIALRAIKNDGHQSDEGYSEEAVEEGSDDDLPRFHQQLLRRGSTLDEFKERGLTFVNPSLITPLQQPWIYQDPPAQLDDEMTSEGGRPLHGQPTLILPNADRSLGIGEDNVWIDSAGAYSPDTLGTASTSTLLSLHQAAGEMSNLTCACGIKRAVKTLSKRMKHDHTGDESEYDAAHSKRHETCGSMRLATETIQSIFSLLSTKDFNAARHTCRLWLFASLDRRLLEDMLKQAGWWSSMLRIITPMAVGKTPEICQEQIMSKWIARESNLARCDQNAFVQVGETDFRSLVGRFRSQDDFQTDDFRLHGEVCFTVSLCGRYMIATLDQLAFIYELNHVCRHGQSAWAVPLRKRQGMPLGFMRPVASIICPRRVLSCSMDTSSGRQSVAFLMEGRVGMVDALTGQDLSRWFPLTTSSDVLYFLPVRRGTDTANKLRLISSASGLLNPLERVEDSCDELSTTIIGSDGTSTASLWGRRRTAPQNPLEDSLADVSYISHFARPACVGRSRALRNGRLLDAGGGEIGTVLARSADHYRAVPISDGYHVLFTDPRTGCLCLGTDAPVGSVTRLLRKVWFRPPPSALSVIPILYAAGSDTRHRVRVVATFAAAGPTGNPQSNKQLIVFFTVPPDLFHDVSARQEIYRSAATDTTSHERVRRQSMSDVWRADDNYQAIDVFNGHVQDSPVFPLEIYGQPIAVWERLTEIALDSSPEMIVWAFSSSGWARAWAVDYSKAQPMTRTAVQENGSIRMMDQDGDILMTDLDGELTATNPEDCIPPDSSRDVDPFDGTVGTNFVERRSRIERASWGTRARGSDRMSGTTSVDLIEEVNGIVRLDVQLR